MRAANAGLVLGAVLFGLASHLKADGVYDFGDAGPAFPTLAADNGARHTVTQEGPFLGPAGDRPDTELDGLPHAEAMGDDFGGADDENGLVLPGEEAILGGAFEGGFVASGYSDPVADGLPDTIPIGWSRYETFDWGLREDSEISAAAGPGGAGDHAVRFARSTFVAYGDVTAIQQPQILHVDWFKRIVLSLDAKVVAHSLPAGGWMDPAFEWPLFVEVQFTDNVGSNRVWRHGWYVDPPGDVGSLPEGTSPVVDPGMPPFAEYRDTLVAAGVWTHAEFDLRDELTNAVTITGVRVGGGGWTFESMADNVSIQAVRRYAMLYGGQAGTVSVRVNGGGGYLDGWVDLNTNGVWDEPGEHVVSGMHADGVHAITLSPPNMTAYMNARFRINSGGDLGFTGAASDGEVEDWRILVLQPNPNGWDFGDAPEAPYPTLAASNGARHWVHVPYSSGPYLGVIPPDKEGNGLQSANALGDDTYPPAGPDDEDGVTTPIILKLGEPGAITIRVSGGGGYLEGWVDFDTNGFWDVGEVVVRGEFADGIHTLPVTLPAGIAARTTYARFRLNSVAYLDSPLGPANDGEVEDYVVVIRDEWKWEQQPDLTTDGMDVRASVDQPPLVLADDFECRQYGAITNIVVWGSWLGDYPPYGDPNAVSFTLSLHADIPASESPTGTSMPGAPLWVRTFDSQVFRVAVEQEGLQEGWYDPQTGFYNPQGDTVCFRYTFPIVPGEAFVQTGRVDRPVVYWLDVQAVHSDGGARFGWKTSRQAWNDTAVWSIGYEPGPFSWNRLLYPAGHTFEGSPVSLAFALYGRDDPWPEEDGPQDFGDAPDQGVGNGYYDYSTLVADNGARHAIQATMPWLGVLPPDDEADGQPALFADGDDLAETDDEDGVGMPALPFVVGYTSWIDVTVSDNSAAGGGVVEAWIDWNQDGVWQHPGEQVYAGFLPSGGHSIPVTPPAATAAGWTCARFRISAAGGLGPTGPASEGEVEDYDLLAVYGDWGDAPDSVETPRYPTLAYHYGACHAVVGSATLFLGSSVDTEFDGQPTADATGDDLAVSDDEDGVTFTSDIYTGLLASVVVWSSGSGYLSAWLDANGDGDWNDAGEQVVVDEYLTGAAKTLAFAVPGDAAAGASMMRFRFSSVPGLSPGALAPDGEVEDYAVTVSAVPEPRTDYGDAPAPYPVLAADDGARHIIPAFFSDPRTLCAMGNALDWAEGVYLGDGIPSPLADGDDLYATDDEDGVFFPLNAGGEAVLVQGSNVVVRVEAWTNSWLSAWVDFNGDGDWDDGGENIAAGWPMVAGFNDLTVTAPSGGPLGPTFARFRSSSMPVPLSTVGRVANGEVEDHRIVVCQPVPAGSGGIEIVNVKFLPGVGVYLGWVCDPGLLTVPQACTSLVEAAANPAAWIDLAPPALPQWCWDTGALSMTSRFYRVVAPHTYP